MKLTLFNGSPRGAASNTNLLMDHFIKGFESVPGNSHERVHLKDGLSGALDAFGKAEVVLLGFPLYADAMPGMVKELIEGLSRYRGRAANPALMFLVQSGFPEASHTRNLVPYLEKLSHRLRCDYLGTIAKGGVEGIQSTPEFMTRSLFRQVRALGVGFGRTGGLDEVMLAKLAGRDMLNRFWLMLTCKLAEWMFWNPQMKNNGVLEQRDARPYAQ